MLCVQPNNAWIPSADAVFELVSIVTPGDKDVIVKTVKGEVKTVKANVVLPSGPPLPAQGVSDMVVLEHLHEASILHNLERRFAANLIYVRY